MSDERSTLPRHYQDRLSRLEAENCMLRTQNETLRVYLNTARAETGQFVHSVFRQCADAAMYDTVTNGDVKEYPSVIGGRIHDKIQELWEKWARNLPK